MKCTRLCILAAILMAGFSFPAQASFWDTVANEVTKEVKKVSKKGNSKSQSSSPATKRTAQTPQKNNNQTQGTSKNVDCPSKPDRATICNGTSKSVQFIVKETGYNYSIDSGGKHALKLGKEGPWTLRFHYWGDPKKNEIITLKVVNGKSYVVRPNAGAAKAADKARKPKKNAWLASYKGKVAMYNDTNKSVSLTIVGQDLNISIDRKSKLARAFSPNTKLSFWFWGQRGKELGRATVNAGAVLRITNSGVEVVNAGKKPAPTAMENASPDFGNPNAVFADLKKKSAACKSKKAQMCVTSCNYAHKTLKNFIKSNPGGDPSIFKQRWKACYDEYVKSK